jgi:hypothetical protein
MQVNIYRSVNKLLGWDGVPAPEEDLPGRSVFSIGRGCVVGNQ